MSRMHTTQPSTAAKEHPMNIHTPSTRRIAAKLAAGVILASSVAAFTAPAAYADTQGSITLHSAENTTLAGHSFSFYRIGEYTDVQTNGNNVESFGLRNTDTSINTNWLRPAIDKVNAIDPDTSDDITVKDGSDEAGAIASVTDAKTLRRLASALADGTGKTGTLTDQTSSADTLTVTLPEGLYLITDSNGLPMILGTKMNGLDPAGQTLGEATIKSKAVEISKKLVLDTGKADEGSLSVGDEADWEMTFTLPNTGNDATTVTGKLVDEPVGQRFVEGSVTAELKDGTDVTRLLDVYKGGETIPANQDVPGDQSVTIAADGFGVSLDRLMAQYPNRAVVIRAKTVITQTDDGAHPQNVKGVFNYYDGTQTVDVPPTTDMVPVTSHGFTLSKVNEADKNERLDNAGFKIQRDGQWLTYDHTTGAWSNAASEADATEFWTGDTNGDGTVDGTDGTDAAGQIKFTGLAAGLYTVTETTAPSGFSSAARPSFTATISDDGDITFAGVGLMANLTATVGDGVQVANVENLAQLPLTGGGFTLGQFIMLAGAFTVLAGASGIVAVRKRHDAHRTTITA